MDGWFLYSSCPLLRVCIYRSTTILPYLWTIVDDLDSLSWGRIISSDMFEPYQFMLKYGRGILSNILLHNMIQKPCLFLILISHNHCDAMIISSILNSNILTSIVQLPWYSMHNLFPLMELKMLLIYHPHPFLILIY